MESLLSFPVGLSHPLQHGAENHDIYIKDESGWHRSTPLDVNFQAGRQPAYLRRSGSAAYDRAVATVAGARQYFHSS